MCVWWSVIIYNKPPLKRGKVGSVFLMRDTQKGYNGCTPIKWWFVLFEHWLAHARPICACVCMHDYHIASTLGHWLLLMGDGDDSM